MKLLTLMVAVVGLFSYSNQSHANNMNNDGDLGIMSGNQIGRDAKICNIVEAKYHPSVDLDRIPANRNRDEDEQDRRDSNIIL